MMDDIFGQETSLAEQSALSEWNAMMLGFLAHSAQVPVHLGAVLQAAPGFAQAHAVQGLFCLLLGRRELIATAEAALRAAQVADAAGGALPRERLYLAALADWLAGAPSGAVTRMEAVLRDHPRDALAIKFSHAMRFVLGDGGGMRRSLERVLPACGPDHPAHGYLLGCHAFALEETGAYRRAETVGRQALWTAPDDAWGLHAVAHVYEMTCDARAGLDWLEGRESAWAHCNNFRYHVWWHKALMLLETGQVEAVLDLYDREIRADRTDDYRDISNATSLLMRLELDGVGVGDRWEELAELCAARTEDGSLIFADLHYLLALVADGREDATAQMLGRIARDGRTGAGDMAVRMADPGVAASEGLAAFGAGDYDRAFALLSRARPAMQSAGGSHAQRDVFERLTIDAGIRAGQLQQAGQLLSERQTLKAGREDAYCTARRALIAAATARQMPAE